jgi:adenylate cyclase class 2
MRFEVEQKFRAGSLDQVAERLARMGASAGQALEQEDSYLGHPCRDFAQTNEALRLRWVGGSSAITYKGPKREGPTKTREEVELPFAGGPEALDGARRVLEALGFRPVYVVRKVRTPYHLTEQGRPIEVALDVVEGPGSFVEVETIAEGDDDLPAAQRAVTDLARSLGLSSPEPRSYLRMALERRAAAADG